MMMVDVNMRPAIVAPAPVADAAAAAEDVADAATAMAQWHAWAHDAAKPLQTLMAPSLVRHCPISYIIVIIYHIIYIIS